MLKNSAAAADAIIQAGTGRLPGADMRKAPSAGQAATHSKQPVHSAEPMLTSLSHRQHGRAGFRTFAAIDA